MTEDFVARTGVMVRDGTCQGEELLEAFVRTLQSEGVRVGGVYQRTERPEAARKRMTLSCGHT